MVGPNCLHGRRDSAYLGDRKCVYHLTPLAHRRVGDLVLITDYLCFNAQRQLKGTILNYSLPVALSGTCFYS